MLSFQYWWGWWHLRIMILLFIFIITLFSTVFFVTVFITPWSSNISALWPTITPIMSSKIVLPNIQGSKVKSVNNKWDIYCKNAILPSEMLNSIYSIGFPRRARQNSFINVFGWWWRRISRWWLWYWSTPSTWNGHHFGAECHLERQHVTCSVILLYSTLEYMTINK